MADSEPRKIPLSVPIKAHGEEIDELVLTGMPQLRHLKGVRIKLGEGGVDFDIGDIPKIIGPMAQIPLGSAERISIRDLGAMLPVVMDFLGVSWEEED